ncbi:MAG: hypothetical protein ABIP30_03155 [Ferruginibacter sp.]
MKKFKIIDTWISIILITGFLLTSLIKRDETFIYGYFVIGGWQVISMIIHGINGWFTNKGSGRFAYHCLVAVIIGLSLLGALVYPVLYLVMIVMIFSAPIMAIGYTMMCYKEVYVKMQRPLALLK